MKPKWLAQLIAIAVLVGSASQAVAQSERFVGVRKDKNEEVILFAIDPLAGGERKVATLHPAGAGIQLLGITAFNARRGTFSYAYTDTAAGKEYMHTVSAINGLTVSRIALPPDVSGIEVVSDAAPAREVQLERDTAVQRKVEWLEQEVRRLQGQINQIRSR